MGEPATPLPDHATKMISKTSVADGVDFYANRIAENASYNGYSVVFLNFNTPAK